MIWSLGSWWCLCGAVWLVTSDSCFCPQFKQHQILDCGIPGCSVAPILMAMNPLGGVRDRKEWKGCRLRCAVHALCHNVPPGNSSFA
jgi:hypothetical protein